MTEKEIEDICAAYHQLLEGDARPKYAWINGEFYIDDTAPSPEPVTEEE